MNRFLLLIISFFLVSSCSNLYYDTTETVRDEGKAIEMINALKNGTLVVQLPCEKRKMEIYENRAKNATDPEKKKLYEEEYENFKAFIKFIQTSLIEATEAEYKFANYAFLPDSAVVAFKNGQRKDIFINREFEFVNDVDLSNSELILFLRGQRYYDYLYLYNWDGSYPPDPFPYYSSIPILTSRPTSYKKLNSVDIMDWQYLFHKAMANLDFKHDNFYSKHNAN